MRATKTMVHAVPPSRGTQPPQLVPHRFKKGVSPNPGGRPKAAKLIAQLIRDQTRDGAELVELVLAIARGQNAEFKAEASRLWAIRWLSDRAFGYAPMTIAIEPPEPADVPIVGQIPVGVVADSGERAGGKRGVR